MDFEEGDITISEEYPSFEEEDEEEDVEESLDDLDITAIYLGDAFNDAVLEEQFNESDLLDDSLVANLNRNLSRSLSDQENSSSGNSESDTTLVPEEEDCLEHTLICTPVIQSKRYAVVSNDKSITIFSREINDSKSDQENLGMRKGKRIRSVGKHGVTSTPLRQISASDVIVSCEGSKGDEGYSGDQDLITDELVA